MKSSTEFEAEVTLDLAHFNLSVTVTTTAHVTGIFGPSGCGKTSFLETVCGLRPRAKGLIRLGDNVWQDSERKLFLPPEKRGIGYVPQNGLLFPHQSVRQNLEFGARRARKNGQPIEKTWNRVVDLLELAPLLDRGAVTLSGGERQRVALGRALCSAPKLLLLDEPLSGLDQLLRCKILPFLRRIREEFDIPMLLVTHDPIEVQALCDDLVVLRNGSIVARGIPRQVLMDPEVFAMAGDRGFENILPCTTVASSDWETVVALGSPSTHLILKLIHTTPGVRAATLVGIPSREILVATSEPNGISSRNVYPAVIQEMHTQGGCELLRVSLHPQIPPLAVEVGRPAVEHLGLHAAKRIYVIVKSMACSLYEDSEKLDSNLDLRSDSVTELVVAERHAVLQR